MYQTWNAVLFKETERLMNMRKKLGNPLLMAPLQVLVMMVLLVVLVGGHFGWAKLTRNYSSKSYGAHDVYVSIHNHTDKHGSGVDFLIADHQLDSESSSFMHVYSRPSRILIDIKGAGTGRTNIPDQKACGEQMLQRYYTCDPGSAGGSKCDSSNPYKRDCPPIVS